MNSFREYFESESNFLKNSSGKRIVFYHGTPKQFKKFDSNFVRSDGTFGKGFYFTPDPERASFFAKIKRINDKEETAPNIIPVYIKMNNPFIFYELPSINGVDSEKIISHGYDGIIYEKNGKIQEVIVYDPKQITSAITDKFLEEISRKTV